MLEGKTHWKIEPSIISEHMSFRCGLVTKYAPYAPLF